ncbi:hypothetical protein A2U01_0063192 [Trifolium medium]|uniref:Uncharacterized protein n=1 Tax=Trifolium medium TaxID=97028 RepID=A0A392RZA7_9FABA|nr:hypothetical protein [Trifolium medium]
MEASTATTPPESGQPGGWPPDSRHMMNTG